MMGAYERFLYKILRFKHIICQFYSYPVKIIIVYICFIKINFIISSFKL